MEDIDFMKEALFEAEKAAKNGEVPVGAVVVLNGRIIGRGRNRREGGYNVCGHAEIEALRERVRRAENDSASATIEANEAVREIRRLTEEVLRLRERQEN